MHIFRLSRGLEEITEEEYKEIKRERKERKRMARDLRPVKMEFSDGDELDESMITEPELLKKAYPKNAVVIVTNSKETQHALELAGIVYERDIDLQKIDFCKVEAQQECVAGWLKIPKLSDVRGDGFKIQFFINHKNIVISDNSGFSMKLIKKIRQYRTKAGSSRERFLYNYLSQLISKDAEELGSYERRIASLEDRVLSSEIDEFHDIIIPLRRELLILRSYYMELKDVGKQLEENENNFFNKRNLPYFGTITDRADRLLGKTVYLLDYVGQVRDAYQIEVAKEQNKNMEFLTVMSTIFYPLTLITGWYGMNFHNMPELQNGYPYVIILSIIVIIVIILIFKKRKIL